MVSFSPSQSPGAPFSRGKAAGSMATEAESRTILPSLLITPSKRYDAGRCQVRVSSEHRQTELVRAGANEIVLGDRRDSVVLSFVHHSVSARAASASTENNQCSRPSHHTLKRKWTMSASFIT